MTKIKFLKFYIIFGVVRTGTYFQSFDVTWYNLNFFNANTKS